MSFLELVLSLDKTRAGFNSILPIVSFDQYCNISLCEMKVSQTSYFLIGPIRIRITVESMYT